MTPEELRLEEARRSAPWKKWGPYLAERQWGTVREDYSDERQRLGLFQPRPGPLARVPLGRGRPGRDLRRPAASLLRARPLERRRSDRQGAPVRPHQHRGQPRRGRQGVLLLPRQHADPLVHEVSLQVSAVGVPLRPDSSRPTAAAAGTRWSTSCSTPASSQDDRYFDVFVEYAKAAPEDILVLITVANRGPEAATAARAAHALVPQHLVLGQRRPRARAAPGRRPARGQRGGRLPRRAGRAVPVLRRGRAVAVHRTTRPTPSGSSASRTRARGSRTPSTTYVVHGRTRRGESGPDGHEGRRALPDHRRRRPEHHDPASPVAGGRRDARRRPVRATSTRSSRRAAGKRTTFYASITPPGVAADAALVMRQALAGMLWSKQFFHYDIGAWLKEHRVDPFAASGAGAAQRPVVPHDQCGRDLDARQVGVPVVRGLGPGLPRRRPRHGGRRLRQAAAAAGARAALPAPERADPRLRVELRRRQPARPRLGLVVRVPPREDADRGGRRRLPEAKSSRSS